MLFQRWSNGVPRSQGTISAHSDKSAIGTCFHRYHYLQDSPLEDLEAVLQHLQRLSLVELFDSHRFLTTSWLRPARSRLGEHPRPVDTKALPTPFLHVPAKYAYLSHLHPLPAHLPYLVDLEELPTPNPAPYQHHQATDPASAPDSVRLPPIHCPLHLLPIVDACCLYLSYLFL